MVVQDRQFNPDGSLLYPVASASTNGPWIGEYFGDLMLVNGKIWLSTPLRRRQSIHRDADVEQRRGLVLREHYRDTHPMHTHLFRFKVMGRYNFDVKGFVAANGGPNGVTQLDDRGREAGLRSALESAPAIPWFQAATAIARGEYVDAVEVVTRIGAAQSRRTPAYAPQSN